MFARPLITQRLLIAVFALAASLLVFLAALYTVSLLNDALWQYSSIARLVKARWIETRVVLDHFVGQSAALIEDDTALPGTKRGSDKASRKDGGTDQSLVSTRGRQYLQAGGASLDIKNEGPDCERARREFKALDARYWDSSDIPARSYLVLDGCAGVLVSSDVVQRMTLPPSADALSRVASFVAQVRQAGIDGPQTPAASGLTWFGPLNDPFNGRQILGRSHTLRDRDGNVRGLIFATIDSANFSRRFQDNDSEVLFGLFAPNGNLVFSDQEFPLKSAKAFERLPSYGVRSDAGRVAFFSGHIWLSFTSPDTGWSFVYGLHYRKFLVSHYPQLIACFVLLAVALAGLFLFSRFLNNHVIAPSKQTARQLIESEAFNRTILETAPVGVCVVRLSDGKIAHQNEMARVLLGPNEGTNAGELILPHIGDAESGNTLLELQGEAQDEVRHVQVAYARTRHQGEAVVLCALTDISVQKQIENALLAARLAADQASEAKSAFLAMMSHEIRTPLYGMLGTLELLSLGHLADAQRTQLQNVELSSKTLLNIINDLLDLSKIDAGQMALESTKLDLPALVERCVQSVASMAQRKGIDLYCHIQPDFPRALLGDEVRLQQVLNNLLSNAIKFTDNGKIVARLVARDSSDKQTEFALQVSDSGIGIAERNRERLFEPFVQADTSTARRFGGTGLGLSICRRLVGLMGGRIELVSELGLGSSFTVICQLERWKDEERVARGREDLGSVAVLDGAREQRDALIALARFSGARTQAYDEHVTLDQAGILIATDRQSLPRDAGQHFSGVVLVLPDGPLKPEQDGAHSRLWRVSAYSQDAIVAAIRLARDLPSHLQAVPELIVPKIPSLRVLVAEDHPINQRLLTDQLETLGCVVTLANNGKEALEAWSAGAFDIVLSDINMPDLDGYGLARQLRALGAKVPIIGLTAYTDAGVRKRADEAGFDALAIKPISLESLASTLGAQIPQMVSDEEEDEASGTGTPLSPDCIPEPVKDVFRSAMSADLALLSSDDALDDLDALRVRAHRMRGALAVLRDAHGVAVCEAIETGAMTGRSKGELSTHIRKLAKHLEPALEADKR
jgi:two-component system capsular synthesis sensor histidine kinase RcsC